MPLARRRTCCPAPRPRRRGGAEAGNLSPLAALVMAGFAPAFIRGLSTGRPSRTAPGAPPPAHRLPSYRPVRPRSPPGAGRQLGQQYCP